MEIFTFFEVSKLNLKMWLSTEINRVNLRILLVLFLSLIFFQLTMKAISEQRRKDIEAMLLQGVSTRQIHKALGISQAMVMKVKKAANIMRSAPNLGRPKIFGDRERRAIVREVTVQGPKTAAEVAKELRNDTGLKFCDNTVRQVLYSSGLSGKVKQKKPKLAPRHVRARIEFARRHQHWTIDDWKRVIFSDESKINRFNSDGREWYWARDGYPLQPSQVVQTVKHGGGSVMVWGCMTYNGGGSLIQVEGRMDQHYYKRILIEQLLPTLDYVDFPAEEVTFQHDNDPKHTAKMVQEWLGEQPFKVMIWPAQSPDLNPIEHLWAKIKKDLNRYSSPPKGMHELYQRIEEVYMAIPVDYINNLYESMPRRIKAVLKAKGYWTKY